MQSQCLTDRTPSPSVSACRKNASRSLSVRPSQMALPLDPKTSRNRAVAREENPKKQHTNETMSQENPKKQHTNETMSQENPKKQHTNETMSQENPKKQHTNETMNQSTGSIDDFRIYGKFRVRADPKTSSLESFVCVFKSQTFGGMKEPYGHFGRSARKSASGLRRRKRRRCRRSAHREHCYARQIPTRR